VGSAFFFLLYSSLYISVFKWLVSTKTTQANQSKAHFSKETFSYNTTHPQSQNQQAMLTDEMLKGYASAEKKLTLDYE